MKLRMLPEVEERYLTNLRRCSNDELSIAKMLHGAAFGGKVPIIPAPVYVEQAMWLSLHGYGIIRMPEIECEDFDPDAYKAAELFCAASFDTEQREFLHDAVKAGTWSDNKKKKHVAKPKRAGLNDAQARGTDDDGECI